MAEHFTKRQGEYLAFIHLYILLNKRPPAEADFQDYFRVSAPAVHQMIVSLENRGLIQKTPGQARSIRLLVAPHLLPTLGDAASQESPRLPTATTLFSERYPNITRWVQERGPIALGYDYLTDSCARAVNVEEMVWSGGRQEETPDEWLQALETAIAEFVEAQGMW